jgi:hypothetical protein
MNFSKHFHKVKQAARVAFAVDTADRPFTNAELALLEKIAAAVVQRRLAGPALLLLESAGQMNFLGSQALHALTPILNLACDTRDLEQAAILLERRDAIPRLIALIEARSARTPRPQ